jgi:hypothetical protein
MTKQEQQELKNLLSIEWNGSERMIQHCLKSSKYIHIDNMYVDVCDAKPSIDSTLYYNDEYPDIGNSYETFINYNMKKAPRTYEKFTRFSYYDDEKLVIIPQYCTDKTGGRLCAVTYKNNDKNQYIEVTPELLEQINAAIEEVRADYKKRLDMYYKKYADKISSYGYWANR